MARKRIEYPPVFLSSEEITSQVSRAVRAGELRKLGPRLYTPQMSDPPEAVIQRNLWEVVGLLFPGTVVGYRTALEGRPSPEGTVNVVGSYRRLVQLPGLAIRQSEGPGYLPGDQPFVGGLWLASRARALLECLRPTRGSVAGSRGLPREEIERRIEQIVRISGEAAVNTLRDDARALVHDLQAQAELEEMNRIIGAVLSSRSGPLSSPPAVARARGEPYDPGRFDLFQQLHGALLRWPSTARSEPHPSGAGFRNAAFIDAYFSNYIEGTEFGVDEAREIVFEGRIPEHQPEDAHDVLGTFRIASSRDEMGLSMADSRNSFQDMVGTLRRRHEIIMSARKDKRPGAFKERTNFAGATEFVQPELVMGTLRRGFEMFRSLTDPFARASFMMFMIAEVHPFLDGNGRMARLMANAELLSQGHCRIIIPTVYREDYLLALRALTRQGRADPLLRMLDRAQEFVYRVDFGDLDQALAILRTANAFMDPSEERLVLPPE